jgi:hypothetical protein
MQQCKVQVMEDKNYPSEPKTKVSQPGLIESFGHYGEFNKFSDFLGHRVDNGGSDNSKEHNKAVLEKHGLQSISPEGLDPYFSKNSEKFTADDWEYIEKAQDKLLAVYSVNNFYEQEDVNQGIWVEPWAIDKYEPNPIQVGDLGALPLVYQTNFKRLTQILEHGEILSDRAYYKSLIAQGKQLNDETEEFFTNTNGDDRRAGLDNYVFTFFGRPHSQRKYGDIEILFKPDRFYKDQESFATEHDFMDIICEDHSEDRYRNEVLQGSYFIRSAARQIKKVLNGYPDSLNVDFLSGDSDQKDQYGGITFSTWEVKTPQLTVTDIDSIVFSDKNELEQFREKYGSRYITILRPDMSTLQAIIKDKTKLSDNFLNKCSYKELVKWCNKYFIEHPEELRDYFGSEKVEFIPENIYKLKNGEKIRDRFIQEDLERGKEMRTLNVPEAEQRTCYMRISFPKKYITSTSDIYKLSPEKIYADLTTPQKEIEEWREWYRKECIKFGMTESREDEVKTVIKITTTQKELEEYEKTKDLKSRPPARLEHYRIDEIIDL